MGCKDCKNKKNNLEETPREPKVIFIGVLIISIIVCYGIVSIFFDILSFF